MHRAVAVAKRGHWPSSQAAAAVTLDYDARYRRRISLDCGSFGRVLLDLPEASVLAEGDGLKLKDGGWIHVHAALEDLLEISSVDSFSLVRIAWHLGNHHCPTDLSASRLRIRRDHVMESLLRGLGCSPIPVRAVFNPEKGAYHEAGQGHGE
ncbi:MAG: urease accessory protein UreE [Rhodobacteraceae bacterium]|nr:urease accessory protein UreE [Paracoccaceae bacterium]MCY4197962.1 urease accessory protein UreE [Paracoccaceae bacterium]